MNHRIFKARESVTAGASDGYSEYAKNLYTFHAIQVNNANMAFFLNSLAFKPSKRPDRIFCMSMSS